MVSQIFINGRCFESEKVEKRIKVEGITYVAENYNSHTFKIHIDSVEDKQLILEACNNRGRNIVELHSGKIYTRAVIAIVGESGINGKTMSLNIKIY